MDQVANKNSLENQWGFSPTIDPDGDEVITASEEGYVYKYKGPHKDISVMPLFNSSLDVFKTSVIIICMTLAVLNVYTIFGCKARYLQYTQPYQTHVVIFFVFLINIFIVSAENYRSTKRLVPTILSMVLAGVCLILFNIVAKLGDSWAFFNVPYWPTLMTWWGLIMNIMMIGLVLNINKQYWELKGKQTFGSKEKENVIWYNKVESILTICLIIAIGVGFTNQLIIQKTLLKDKFSFLRFFFGTGSEDKELTNTSFKSHTFEGHCKKKAFAKFDKEVKKGIKNSYWTRFLQLIK